MAKSQKPKPLAPFNSGKQKLVQKVNGKVKKTSAKMESKGAKKLKSKLAVKEENIAVKKHTSPTKPDQEIQLPKKTSKPKKVKRKQNENSQEETVKVGNKTNEKLEKQKKKKMGEETLQINETAKLHSVEMAAESSEKLIDTSQVDEGVFDSIVNQANVLKVVDGLKTILEKELKTKKTPIFSDYNFYLNVSCFTIANCPKRMYKLNLKHAIVDPAADDVLLIVPDLKRGAKVEFESTITHYTDLLREQGVTDIKIMPFNQLRNEYKMFEAKRKLANTYDYFLCDGRIAGQIAGFCGKTFQKSRSTFYTVRMKNPNNLKSEIEKAMRRTAYRHFAKGDLTAIRVGTDKLSSEQIAENIIKVVSQLKKSYPGGLENIRTLNIQVNIRGTPSLPIYACTLGGPKEVPNVIGPREKRMLQLKKESNNILSKFALTKEAELVKLNKTQIERKRKFKDMYEVLTASKKLTIKDASPKPVDKEECADDVDQTPPKEARKSTEKKSKNKIAPKKKAVK